MSEQGTLDQYLASLQLLSSTVRNRPVGIICYGDSLRILDEGVSMLKDIDICWATVNYYPISSQILAKIQRDIEVAFFVSNNQEHYPKASCSLIKHSYRPLGNSLYELLLMCIAIKVGQVFIFGADGFVVSSEYPLYGCTRNAYPDHRYNRYAEDCRIFNDLFPTKTGATKVYLCSPDSHIDCIQKITLEDVQTLTSLPTGDV